MSALDGLKLLTRIAGTLRLGRRELSAPRTSDEPVPPAPWLLRGDGVIAQELVPLALAAEALPAELAPVAAVPGHTLAMTFMCRYEASPVGPYHEAMRVAALVRARGVRTPPGFFVTWIPVDSERSVQGGRALWGLPKALGSFAWEGFSGRVAAPAEGTLALSSRGGRLAVPATIVVPFLTLRGGALQRYAATFAAHVAPASVTVDAPAEHPGRMRGRALGGVQLRSFALEVSAATDL